MKNINIDLTVQYCYDREEEQVYICVQFKLKIILATSTGELR